MMVLIGLWAPPVEAGVDEEVLWWVRSSDAALEEGVIQGIEEGLGERNAQHLVGEEAVDGRVQQGLAMDEACLMGRSRCGEPRAMIMKALGIDLWIAADVEAEDDFYKARYEVIDRRGERAGEGTVEADQAEGVGLALVSEIIEAVAVIAVQSEPEGAQLEVDGQVVGRTPISRAVPVGERELRLSYEGTEPWEQRRRVEAGEYLEVEVELSWRPAMVTIAGAPSDAHIYLDGQRVDWDEGQLAVAPGRRYLVVEAAGYEPERRHIEVEADEEVEVQLEMERQMGWLRDIDTDAIVDRRFQAEVGLEMGVRRTDLRGDRFDSSVGPALMEGWLTDNGEVADSGRGKRLAPGPGLRLGVAWEGQRLGIEWLSLSVARHSLGDRLQWRNEGDQVATGRSTRLIDLEVRPMQVRGRWVYENLAIRAQGGLGMHMQAVSLTSDGGERIRYRRYQPQLNVEFGARYHFDERWSVGAYYRPAYGFGDGLSHHLSVMVGGGLKELPGLRSRPPGEL